MYGLDESTINSLRTCILQARAFAAKGLISTGLHEVSEWAMWMNSARGGAVGATNTLGAMEPTGVKSAMDTAEAGHSTDGRFDRGRGRFSVCWLLREIGHVQRVGGNGDLQLISRLMTIASHGAEYVPLVARLVCQMQMLRIDDDNNMSRSLNRDRIVRERLAAAGFSREALGVTSYGIPVAASTTLMGMGKYEEALVAC